MGARPMRTSGGAPLQAFSFQRSGFLLAHEAASLAGRRPRKALP
jgi:hypothetical protein